MYKHAVGASHRGGTKKFAQQKTLPIGKSDPEKTAVGNKRRKESPLNSEPNEREEVTLDIPEGMGRERLPLLLDVIAQVELRERRRLEVEKKIKAAGASQKKRQRKRKRKL